jgi:lipopolysaccharide biosynthesis glycosyltransferase
VTTLGVTDEEIEQWKGPHHFFFRVKIKAMELLAARFPDEHILYLDSDTCLYGSLDVLKQRLDKGCGMMHIHEGHPSRMKGGSLKLWNTVKGHTYADITLGERHDMWNAGVVAVPKDRLNAVIATSLAICDGMLDDGGNCFILEQYAQSVCMSERTQLMAADDCICHFWGNKEEWESVASELLLRSYMKQSTLQDELDAITPELLKAHPVYVHKSSTARKLQRLAARLFPDSRHRYVE